jgi:hypothetical protein
MMTFPPNLLLVARDRLFSHASRRIALRVTRQRGDSLRAEGPVQQLMHRVSNRNAIMTAVMLQQPTADQRIDFGFA